MTDNFFRWIFFLMNPFASMIVTFLDFTSENAKNLFWAFCTFFGFTFAIGDESSSSDINRYLLELQWMFNQDEFTMADSVQYFVLSGEIDMLRTFLSYIISRFTDSQAVLTTVYGFIFGFFFSRNIWYIFSFIDRRLTIIEKILFLALILVVPIWFLNGFRMYTAFHIFMFGLLPYILENKKKKLIWVLLSVLVHFSYIVPISILLVYFIFGNQLKLYFFIFILSIFISDLNVNNINQYVEKYAPTLLDERSASYRAEDRVEQTKKNYENSTKNWYSTWYLIIIRWSLIVVLFYFFIFADARIKYISEWKKLFCLTLLFYAFANVVIAMPSGIRFLSFALFLTLTMIILYITQFRSDSRFNNLILLLGPAFLLFIIVSIRIGLYSTSLTTILGNPILAIFTAGENISINDLLK